jgi:hypothetical protein
LVVIFIFLIGIYGTDVLKFKKITHGRIEPMNKTNTLEQHPLPPAGWWMICAAGLLEAEVYRYFEDRWYLRAEDGEYMLIDLGEDGLSLVDNPF